MTPIDPLTISQDEVDATWVAFHGAEHAGGPLSVVLGLDLGTTFAWATVSAGDVVGCGWYDTARKGEGGGMKYLRFRRALCDMLDAIRPTLVWYELPLPRGSYGTETIRAQVGILEAELTDRRIAYGGVNVSTLKKFSTGKGNAGKDLMREALAAKLATP